ncbi:MAG: DUF302 domain-containing protein [Bacteroidales bacterium]|nr:DUF302 domain-containing protein [Bacteroidales bacterium]
MKTNYFFIGLLILIASSGLFAQEAPVSYFFSTTVNAPFDETTERVKELLKENGFGVVTELDMDQKIEEKLEGVDLKPYKLLGVCNPKMAYDAMQAEENIGLFLPCKMIIKEIDENTTEVVSVDPSVMMKMLGNPKLTPIGDQVTVKLKAVIDRLKE